MTKPLASIDKMKENAEYFVVFVSDQIQKRTSYFLLTAILISSSPFGLLIIISEICKADSAEFKKISQCEADSIFLKVLE